MDTPPRSIETETYRIYRDLEQLNYNPVAIANFRK